MMVRASGTSEVSWIGSIRGIPDNLIEIDNEVMKI